MATASPMRMRQGTRAAGATITDLQIARAGLRAQIDAGQSRGTAPTPDVNVVTPERGVAPGEGGVTSPRPPTQALAAGETARRYQQRAGTEHRAHVASHDRLRS